MNFGFNLQSIQDSLPTVGQVKESFSSINAGKKVEQLKESIQPFAEKTTQMISGQVQQLQQLADTPANIEVSPLPADYLELEKNCDFLLGLYTDLIQYTDVFSNVSYDYPPGNSSFAKLKNSNFGELMGQKFNQLKTVSSPQELEKILTSSAKEEEVSIQTTSAQIPRTLHGKLLQIADKFSTELKETNSPLSLALLHFSSAYLEIANSRLVMDKKITNDFAKPLVSVLNDEFIKVNELRKKVYTTRSSFDLLRAKHKDDEENEEIIAKEDDFVGATELAVLEMKKLLKPSKGVSLLKVFVDAQRDWLELSAKKLATLLKNLDSIDLDDEDDE